MYHGIIIDQSFTNSSFPNNFKVFAKRRSGMWVIYGIETEDKEIDETVSSIQNNMKSDEAWYAHLYNDKKLIVIFKYKIFRVTPQSSSWESIIKYGVELNIPKEQLDFWPNRFQDEIHYFKKEDFIK